MRDEFTCHIVTSFQARGGASPRELEGDIWEQLLKQDKETNHNETIFQVI
jgi:hypothetical protein